MPRRRPLLLFRSRRNFMPHARFDSLGSLERTIVLVLELALRFHPRSYYYLLADEDKRIIVSRASSLL